MESPEDQQIPRTVNVDGDMSSEKLDELLAWGSEENELDYKDHCDLSSNHDKVELIRDIVAMANTQGGYIVIGVSEDRAGAPRFSPDGCDPSLLRGFDASTVRSVLENYVDEALDLQLTTVCSVTHPGVVFGLIFVPPSNRTPLVLSKNAQYHDPVKNKSYDIFREGDVVVRRNTSSIRANQSDWRRFVSDIRRRERNAWAEDVLSISSLTAKVELLLSQLQSGSVQPSPGEPDETAYLLTDEQFAGRFTKVLASGNDVIARQWLDFGTRLFRDKLSMSVDKSPAELSQVRDNLLIPTLNALTTAAWLLIRHGNLSLFVECVNAFEAIYGSTATVAMGKSNDPEVHFSPSLVWELVIERIYLIGGLAVLYKSYGYIPTLARRHPLSDRDFTRAFWARRTLTILGREHRLAGGSLCRQALTSGPAIPYIWQQFDSEDKAIGGICQYDFLQNVLALCETRDPSEAYPSFGRFFNHRTEPIVSDLVRGGESRSAMPGVSDVDLAWAIDTLDEYAAREFFRNAAWDRSDWSDERIREFLRANLHLGKVRG